MEHSIELKIGYKDKNGNVHKTVTFGHRPTLGQLVLLDSNPLASNATHYELLIRMLMITKFGDEKIPLKPNVLVSLDTIDDDLLRSAADTFLSKSKEDRSGEFLEGHAYRLHFPIEIEGASYDIIQFGRRLTVSDNVEADNLRLGDGISKAVFKVCKQITELRDSESGLKRGGQLEPKDLSSMDGEDFSALRIAAEFFRFDLPGQPDAESRNGEDRDGDRKADGLDGSGDPSDAAKPNE